MQRRAVVPGQTGFVERKQVQHFHHLELSICSVHNQELHSFEVLIGGRDAEREPVNPRAVRAGTAVQSHAATVAVICRQHQLGLASRRIDIVHLHAGIQEHAGGSTLW